MCTPAIFVDASVQSWVIPTYARCYFEVGSNQAYLKLNEVYASIIYMFELTCLLVRGNCSAPKYLHCFGDPCLPLGWINAFALHGRMVALSIDFVQFDQCLIHFEKFWATGIVGEVFGPRCTFRVRVYIPQQIPRVPYDYCFSLAICSPCVWSYTI